MFHAVGITPEAPTLADAVAGATDVPTVEVGLENLRTARDDLSTVPGGDLGGVALGTPHASARELEHIAALFASGTVAPGISCSVNTGRDVLASSDAASALAATGVEIVTDTCTYLKPVMSVGPGQVFMTDSAKWAYYAPANIGAEVVFGSTEDCVASAIAGEVTRNDEWWHGT